jgi:hypothetical protein
MDCQERCDGCQRLPVCPNPNFKIRRAPARSKTGNNPRVIAENARRVAAVRN